MTRESDAPPTPPDAEPAPATDAEHALRLVDRSAWSADANRINSGAFYYRKPTESVFIEERLPDQDGEALHVDRFRSSGRIRIPVSTIRAFKRNGVAVGVDVVMTGTADPPLEAFGEAHGELTGIAPKKIAQAFARYVAEHCEVEQTPTQ